MIFRCLGSVSSDLTEPASSHSHKLLTISRSPTNGRPIRRHSSYPPPFAACTYRAASAARPGSWAASFQLNLTCPRDEPVVGSSAPTVPSADEVAGAFGSRSASADPGQPASLPASPVATSAYPPAAAPEVCLVRSGSRSSKLSAPARVHVPLPLRHRPVPVDGRGTTEFRVISRPPAR